MEEAKSQVPPEMKPVLELIVKRAQERLAALEDRRSEDHSPRPHPAHRAHGRRRALAAQAPAIPDNPDKLVFAPIAYTPPVGQGLPRRPEEQDGRVHRGRPDAAPREHRAHACARGRYLVPAGKEGLAGLTGSQIRRGGTKTLTAEQLDEKLDFLAANVEHRRSARPQARRA